MKIKQILILFRFIRAYIEISIDTYVLILYHWRFDVDFTKLSNLISPQESNTLPFPFTSASESIFLHMGTFKSRCERTFKLRRGANFSFAQKKKDIRGCQRNHGWTIHISKNLSPIKIRIIWYFWIGH